MESIHRWIARDSEIQATRILEQIWQRTQILVEFPRLGHLWQEDGSSEIRFLFYGHHKVAYRYDPGSELVEVLGVYHGRMEVERHLNPGSPTG
jgi:plasmid stabilization system protein ParE